MAWRRPGDKPLSEPMVVSSPTHIYVARPQWVMAVAYTIPPNFVMPLLQGHTLHIIDTLGLVKWGYHSTNLTLPKYWSFSWKTPFNIFIQISMVFALTGEIDNMLTSSNGNICALLALCAGNSPVTGEFSSQRPVTRSFDVSLIGALNKRLSKQSWGC